MIKAVFKYLGMGIEVFEGIKEGIDHRDEEAEIMLSIRKEIWEK